MFHLVIKIAYHKDNNNHNNNHKIKILVHLIIFQKQVNLLHSNNKKCY